MKKLIPILFGLLLLVIIPTLAQNNVSIQNLSTLNVDDLSDEQIRKFSAQLQSSGYTEQQLEILAKSRGMSDAQIAKLRERMLSVQASSTPDGGTATSTDRMRTAPDFVEESQTVFDPFTSMFPEKTQIDDLPVFGQSFFENSELRLEAPVNIPTPVNYVIGPGDQLIIDIWGASEQTYQLMVSPEGSILIPSLGPIFLSGLTIEKADQRIRNKLKSIYSTLGDNTFAQISLGQIRTIQVNVIGEVVRPGSFSLSSFATPINALYAASGPSANGSFRQIHVFRGGAKVANFDLYDFLVYGREQSIKLQDQDVILVKPYANRVRLDGAVKRPAYYEVLPEETFSNLLDISGGLTELAYRKTITLQRNLSNSKTVITVAENAYGGTVLQNGDRIEVGQIADRFSNRVRIEGAVNHPGEFELTAGMTLKDLLNLADGLRGDAFLGQGLLIRQSDDYSLASLSFDPRELSGAAGDIILQNEDLVKIQSIFDLREDFSIAIDGEVNSPGKFPYVSGMTVENLIFLAGGFKESAARSFVEVARRVPRESDSDNQAISSQIFNFPISATLTLNETASEFVIQPFDMVIIRRSPFFETHAVVSIEGEVKFPGKYVINKKDERLSDLLIRAGGLTNFAYAKGATLIRQSEYSEQGEESSSVSRVKRTDLIALLKRDSLLEGQSAFREEEFVGIDLVAILKNPGGKDDILLKEGDILSVPTEPTTIRVRGEVLYPGVVKFEEGAGFRYFLARSGGRSESAKLSQSYVIYPNGEAIQTKSFLGFKNYPTIKPGSELIIPPKEFKRPLSPQEVIGMSSAILSMVLIIDRLVN